MTRPTDCVPGASDRTTQFSRRRFLGGLAAGAALGLAAGGRSSPTAEAAPAALPDPNTSGLEHVVVVTMENRSFDHFLGWLPGADGQQAGLSYPDRNGAPQPTHHLTDFQGCGHPDPDHSLGGALVEYNHGACDGWLKAGQNDEYCIGYYTQPDLAFLRQAAPSWTTCDRYFAAVLAPTYPNRIYMHAAQTDRTRDLPLPTSLPTIWDRLAAAGLSHNYYFSDVSFLALWGLKYLGISRPFQSFLLDCALGILPRVAYVDPGFLGESSGTSGDDHPYGDIRTGEAFLNQVYNAVTSGPQWRHTLLVITFDEWGGFFDHVPPPRSVPPGTRNGVDDKGMRGFRVPCLLISPWSPRGTVAHDVYDHTSILKLIEWRWNLAPLTNRDKAANNLATALHFAAPNLLAPRFNVPPGPFGGPCPGGAQRSAEADAWEQLHARARTEGWPG